MAEAFGFYVENILTKDYFESVLEARLRARFAEQDAKFESRFAKVDRTLFLHTWMLGIIFIVVVVPQVQVWLS